MKYNVKTIEEYINVIPPERKKILVKIISILHEYFPELQGNMKYDMPSFEPVCSIASQKNYISVYIHHFDVLDKYRNDIMSLKVGKSCIRFKNSDQLPEKVFRNIFNEIKSKE